MSVADSFSEQHRPWPLPQEKWKWRQQWNQLLFLHWEVDGEWLREKIPSALEIDLHNGKAWIGIVPFSMKGVTRRGLPAPRFLCDFPEINVRTYVVRDGKPGVWFFSLDVTSALAAWVARTFFHLPYYKGKISVEEGEGSISYRLQRGNKRFKASYQPVLKKEFENDSFAIWATERYCLYCQDPQKNLYRGEIHHQKWPLQQANVQIFENTLLDDIPVGAQHPDVLYSESINVRVYSLKRFSVAIPNRILL